MPIPELIPGVPEVVRCRGDGARPFNLHAGATREVVGAFGFREFDTERDWPFELVGRGPVAHTEGLRNAHFDQGTGIFWREVA